MTILMLHPGDMGSVVGACLLAAGHRVVWVSDGRSPSTRSRAESAGLVDVVSLDDAVRESETVFSVCPPHGAVDLAAAVAGVGFAGVYVDANAVSPATSRQIQLTVESGGGSYVDGGIVGPPPVQPDSTRLYLSGPDAVGVADLFTGTNLEARVLDGPVGSASALKMVYAAWSKGSTALLETILAVARVEGVEPDLRKEWEISLPGLEHRAKQAAGSARKAWRWVAEMEEIADTFAAAGLPDGFHRAAAKVFERLESFKDEADITIEAVVDRLASDSEG